MLKGERRVEWRGLSWILLQLVQQVNCCQSKYNSSFTQLLTYLIKQCSMQDLQLSISRIFTLFGGQIANKNQKQNWAGKLSIDCFLLVGFFHGKRLIFWFKPYQSLKPNRKYQCKNIKQKISIRSFALTLFWNFNLITQGLDVFLIFLYDLNTHRLKNINVSSSRNNKIFMCKWGLSLKINVRLTGIG